MNTKIFKHYKIPLLPIQCVITKYVYTFIIGTFNFYYTPYTNKFHKGI